jgi:hypothetical protein
MQVAALGEWSSNLADFLPYKAGHESAGNTLAALTMPTCSEVVMAAICNISAEYARSILDYDPDSGILSWKIRKSQACPAGKKAGYLAANGYIQIEIDGRAYYAHRVAWLLSTGQWPSDFIDHINSVKTDNRRCNLREATMSENKRNMGARADNKSGVKGVYWNRKDQKWMAAIKVDGKSRHLGSFLTLEAAAKAYANAAPRVHGKFARLK